MGKADPPNLHLETSCNFGALTICTNIFNISSPYQVNCELFTSTSNSSRNLVIL